MDFLARRIMKNSIDTGLINHGDHIVLGVSGGADSVALLMLLAELREICELRLLAVHVNHGLRGEEADRDQAYVEALCQDMSVPCYSYRIDISEMARSRHISEEEAGRSYRYQCFESVRAEHGADKIAVAHHRDDVAETVLMNLFRGSGIKGMIGIPAMRGDIIRPLLCISRREIEAYLERRGISYCTDATNLKTDYTRNRIRIDVLPYVNEHINAAASAHIAESAAITADICRFLEREARRAAEGCVKNCIDNESLEIDAVKFLELDIALQREILRQMLGLLAGRMKDIGLVHVEAVRKLIAGGTGHKIQLPYNMEAEKIYDILRIFRQTDMSKARECTGEIAEGGQDNCMVMVPIELAADKTQELCLDGRNSCLRVSVFDADKNMQIPKSSCVKWFDYDRILQCVDTDNGLVVRKKLADDYMIIGGGHRKSLRRILMDDKISRENRDQLAVMAVGAHVLWMLDTGRISEEYKITGETRRILCFEIHE